MLGAALPFHLTWTECLGTLTPSTSFTRWGLGALESQGPQKEMSSESSHCLACLVPGKCLRGHLQTFPLPFSWREVRYVRSFCPSLLLHPCRQPMGSGLGEGRKGICARCPHLLPWLGYTRPPGATPPCSQVPLHLCHFILPCLVF